MRQFLFSLSFLLFSSIAFTQNRTIVGSWIWQDAKNSTSLLVKADSNITKHSGLKDLDMTEQAQKKGKYIFSDNNLFITWEDNTVETIKINFLNNNTLQLISDKDASGKALTFKKVIDIEEISR